MNTENRWRVLSVALLLATLVLLWGEFRPRHPANYRQRTAEVEGHTVLILQHYDPGMGTFGVVHIERLCKGCDWGR